MELLELKNRIIASYKGEPKNLKAILEIIENDNAIFPFNAYEHLLHHLVAAKGLTFEKYLEIRSDYIRQNPNLWLFEISAPRGFGEKFAQTYLTGMCPDLKSPSKQIDKKYNGEYDFWLDGIKIEVKASRAVDSNSEDPLYMKALATKTEKSFLMNFQQLKPSCCDVFIWLAVFRDEIITWVINAQLVLRHPLFSKGQHRGNHGNEGQMHITEKTIAQLDRYRLVDGNLKKAVFRQAKISKPI